MMRKVRIMPVVLLLLALIPLVLIIKYLGNDQEETKLFDSVRISDNSDKDILSIGLHYDTNHDSDTWYAFLPSVFDPQNIHLSFKGCDHIELEDINGVHYSFDNNDRFKDVRQNETYYIEFCDKRGGVIKKGKFMMMQSKKVPALFINTESGSLDYIHSSKKHSEVAEMLLKNTDGNIEYRGRLSSIKGRGNTTWGYDKRPYAIILEKSTSLLGMSRSKNWALIANYVDRSEIRDRFVKYIAGQMDMKFVPGCEYVDLYCNGEYRGLYLLSEKNEVDKQRLDIEDLQLKNRRVNVKPLGEYSAVSVNASDPGERRGFDISSPEDITGGYLFEKNYSDRYTRFPSRFRLNSGEKYCIRSPYNASMEEVEYIAGIMQKIEDGAAEGEDVSEYADLKSFADKYLLEEFVANEASGATSSFFYKDSDRVDSHVFAGPAWDYDKCLGNAMNPMIDDVRHMTFLTAHASNTKIFFNLVTKNEDFRTIVRDEYLNVFRPIIQKIINDGIVYEYAKIPTTDEMEPLRWQGNIDNVKNVVEDVEQFSIGRLKFFDDIFIDNDDVCIITFDDRTGLELGVISGEAIGELPPADEGSKWINEANGEEINEMSVITESITVKQGK